ncbi:MAG: Fe-S cluster assembly ATPase SufC [Pseudomonadota bacterium]|nr:Fe-S cluster assembly ATPase SufC [Pseudomonadota bacterium]
MLSIKHLNAQIVEGDQILKQMSLELQPGEVHAIMGPNGSGKSTLSSVLMGHPGYEVTSGQVIYQNQDLLQMSVDERALAGVFLAFQYPMSIPGVSVLNFLQTVVNVQRKKKNESLLDAYEIIQKAELACARVGLDKSFLSKSLNEGFSGGEKKRVEVIQMLMLNPKLIIMDETDSGLDIDSIKKVSEAVSFMRDGSRSFLIVTHYKRILDTIKPDKVHVFHDGHIIQTGDMALADRLEQEGYDGIVNQSSKEHQ